METIKIQKIIDLLENIEGVYAHRLKEESDDETRAINLGAHSMLIALSALMEEAKVKDSLEEVVAERLEYKQGMEDIKRNLGWT